jgi:hypothetical protein
MKWAELSERERDALVAEKVLKWTPGVCDGEMGEQPCSPDGWFCQKCGFEGYWGDSFEHQELPKHYTTSLDAAWQVVKRINIPEGSTYETYARFIKELEKIVGSNMFFDLFYCDLDGDDHLTPERLCIAALRAVGETIDV